MTFAITTLKSDVICCWSFFCINFFFQPSIHHHLLWFVASLVGLHHYYHSRLPHNRHFYYPAWNVRENHIFLSKINDLIFQSAVSLTKGWKLRNKSISVQSSVDSSIIQRSQFPLVLFDKRRKWPEILLRLFSHSAVVCRIKRSLLYYYYSFRSSIIMMTSSALWCQLEFAQFAHCCYIRICD